MRTVRVISHAMSVIACVVRLIRHAVHNYTRCTISGLYRLRSTTAGARAHARAQVVLRGPSALLRAQAWSVGHDRKLSVATPPLQTLS